MATLIVADLLDSLCTAVDTARAGTNNTRWLNAINAGYDWLLQQEVITFDVQHHELTVPSATTEGRTYRANGSCQCEAFARSSACWHRAAARLVRRALEAQQFSRRTTARTKAYSDLMECFA